MYEPGRHLSSTEEVGPRLGHPSSALEVEAMGPETCVQESVDHRKKENHNQSRAEQVIEISDLKQAL